KAERQLHEAAQHHPMHRNQARPTSAVPRTGKTNVGPIGEPQALSDAQMAATIPVLANAATYLSQANHNFGGHRTKAVADLKTAIVELEKALQYSKLKNQNKK